MARRRTFTRRGMKRSASAFAPGTGKAGRTIAWEQLSGSSFTPQALGTLFPTLAHSTASIETRFMTLMPANVTRGTVTLERVRGFTHVWFDETQTLLSLIRWPVVMSMQLVPIRDGTIQITSVLSARNTADLESNRLIWIRGYYPANGTPIIGPGATNLDPGNWMDTEVDIKSRRRFDRATWALILVVDVDATAKDLHLGAISLRALFRSPDGV